MDSKKEMEMALSPVTSSTSNTSDDDTSSQSSGHPGESRARKLIYIGKTLENLTKPSAGVTDLDGTETNSYVAGNEVNAIVDPAQYVGIVQGISAQYNEARKGKKPCEDTKKLSFGLYLADVDNKDVLTKIGKDSAEGRFYKHSGTMCRAVVRGKKRGINDNDDEANHTMKRTEFADVEQNKAKRRNGNVEEDPRNEVRNSMSNTVNPIPRGGLRGTGGYNRYTQLQKWEYENNLPVDGVKDVGRWAIEVGLADDGDKDMPKKINFKGHHATEPPKYGTSSIRMIISSPLGEQSSPHDSSDSDTDAEKQPNSEDKGKKKM